MNTDILSIERRLDRIIVAELLFQINGTILHIDSAWVHPEYRRGGVLKGMIQFDLLSKYSNVCTHISVDCTDSSKKIWKKLGFEFKRGSYSSVMIINKIKSIL